MTFLAPLTSLRFLAAVAVGILHLQQGFGYQTGNINFAPAITFFFVLSGFILTHVYREFPDRRSIARYCVSRVARLWPLHVVTATYFLWFIHVPTWETIVANLLLVQSWSMELATAMAMNGVSWSISVEVFFYLMFPAVILTRRYWPLWLLGSVVTVVIGIVMATKAGEVEAQMIGKAWVSFLQVGPPARFLEFLVGILTALIYRRYSEIKMPRLAWTMLEVSSIMLIIFVCSIDILAAITWVDPSFSLQRWLVFSGSFPIMCLVVLCFAYNGGYVSKILSFKPLIFLGDMSFAIYMVHQLVYVTWLHNGWTPNTWNPAALFLIWAQIMAVSALCFLLVERPAKALLLSFYSLAERRMWPSLQRPTIATGKY